LPASFVVKHGIENNEELTHAGGKRGLGQLAEIKSMATTATASSIFDLEKEAL
jgi:hypothetical protein